jgi:hypothetical protein
LIGSSAKERKGDFLSVEVAAAVVIYAVDVALIDLIGPL